MKLVEHWRWWLPSRIAGKKPHLSSWKMDAEEAAKHGALRPEPSTREVREIPETDEERRRAMVRYQSAGRDGAAPPTKEKDPPGLPDGP